MFRNQCSVYALIPALLLLLTVSCDSSLTSFHEQPPELPPVSSMMMNFSGFDQGQSKAIPAPELNAESVNYSNFGNAAVRVLIVKSAVNLNLAIPKAILIAAHSAEPELNENNEWVWSYSNTAEGKDFEVRLVASSENGNDVLWQFFITNTELDLDNHLFFEGVTSTNAQSGTWTYYQLLGDESGDAISEVSWNIVNEEQRQLRLDILSDRNGNLGDFIEYELDAPIKRVTYFNAEKEETAEIEWNSETLAGYLIAPDYNEGERACWGSNLANTPCD